MKGWMYILECADGSYYTGSTNNIELRLQQHQTGEGANHTKKRLPVKLVYTEEFQRIDEAFYREKQVQGWSRKKKEALINGNSNLLPTLAIAYRDLHTVVSRASTTGNAETSTIGNTETSTTGISSLPEVSPLPEVQPLPEALEGNTDTNSILELI